MKSLISIITILLLSSCSLLNYESKEVTGKVLSSEPYSYKCVTPFTSSRLNSNYYLSTNFPSYWYTNNNSSIFRLNCRNDRYNIKVQFINPLTGKEENKTIRRFKNYEVGKDLTFNFYYKK